LRRLYFNYDSSKNWVYAVVVMMLGISLDEAIDFGDAQGSKLLHDVSTGQLQRRSCVFLDQRNYPVRCHRVSLRLKVVVPIAISSTSHAQQNLD
jgi:hypothetical protein